MGISFNSALGIHEDAVRLRSQRQVILSNNIANADTPGYKARDIDFKVVMQDIEFAKGKSTKAADGNLQLLASTRGHIGVMGQNSAMGQNNEQNMTLNQQLQYRVPLTPSQDGNTVEASQEYVEFAANALRYQASLQFLSGKFKSMLMAFRGGQ